MDLDSSLVDYAVHDAVLAPAGDTRIVRDTLAPLDFTLAAADAHVTAPEHSNDDTFVQDRRYRRTWASHTRQHKQMSVTKTAGRQGLGRPAWSSSNTAVARPRFVGADGATI